MPSESAYQAKLINRLKEAFPGCVIMKNDAAFQQGILDLTVLWGDHWASLEVKASIDSKTRPNQEFFVERLNEMSFAAFICPENEQEVLDALEKAFSPRGRSRVS